MLNYEALKSEQSKFRNVLDNSFLKQFLKLCSESWSWAVQ